MRILALIILSLFSHVSIVDARELLTINDFTFIGGFKTPVGPYRPNGLTHRYIDGVLHFYTISGAGGVEKTLHEFEAPVLLSQAEPFGRGINHKSFGNLFNGISMTYADAYGDPWWDPIDSRMYWVSTMPYDNGFDIDRVNFGYSILDDAQSTATVGGSWILDRATSRGGRSNRYANSASPIPADFANAHLNGRRIAVGFGGWVSIISNSPGSTGPTAFAIYPPDPETNPSGNYLDPRPLELMSHLFGEARATRPDPDMDLMNLRNDPPYQFTRGHFGLLDEMRHGVWISTTNKHGLLSFGQLAGGNCNTVISEIISSNTFVGAVDEIKYLLLNDRIYIDPDGPGPLSYQIVTVTEVSNTTGQFTVDTAVNNVVEGTATVRAGEMYEGGGQRVPHVYNPVVVVYNPDRLASVVAGNVSPVGLAPDFIGSWPLPGVSPVRLGPTGTDYPAIRYYPRGVTFDPTTNILYLLTYAGNGVGDIWAYQLDDTVEPPPSPTPIRQCDGALCGVNDDGAPKIFGVK